MKGKKTGGRVVGSTNKTPKEAKALLLDWLHRNIGDLDAIYADLPPFERMKMIIQIAKMLIPTPPPEVETDENEQSKYNGGHFSIEKIEIVHTTMPKEKTLTI